MYYRLDVKRLEQQEQEIGELRVDLNSTVEKVNEITLRLAFLESLNNTLEQARKAEQLDLPVSPH